MVGFPLLLIPLAIYNIIVFLMPDVSFTDPLVKLTLVSGAEWTVTLSDVLLTLAILLLLAEVIKGARPGAKYLTDHLLSLIVFGAAAAEFALWPKFATSTYFLMTALSLVDFISGLALRTRRRAVAVAAAPAPPPKAAAKVEAPAAEPEPAPAPAARACCALGAGGNNCRRIRVAGSPRAETGASRRHARGGFGRPRGGLAENAFPGSLVTGSPVAGNPAGQRPAALAGQTGHASALI